jgi:RNA polymerase sigma factor (sigma-70 family)
MDQDAWNFLFQHLWPHVLLCSRRALPGSTPWSDAEDVAQEVFLRLARVLQAQRLELPTSERGIHSLLAVMARNCALDHFRREHRQSRDRSRQQPIIEEIPAPPQVDLETHDLLEHLLAALDRFDQRLVWLLLDGYTHESIAAYLRISTKTVQRHLSHITQVYNDLRNETFPAP